MGRCHRASAIFPDLAPTVAPNTASLQSVLTALFPLPPWRKGHVIHTLKGRDPGGPALIPDNVEDSC